MNKIDRGTYTLLLSQNPCEVFTYFDVDEMHGLSFAECVNLKDNTYIAGWANYVPKESNQYNENDKRFVFINLLRCTDSIKTFALIMHEMMHHSFFIHNYNMDLEEEIITWAENESHEVYKIITQTKNTEVTNE